MRACVRAPHLLSKFVYVNVYGCICIYAYPCLLVVVCMHACVDLFIALCECMIVHVCGCACMLADACP